MSVYTVHEPLVANVDPLPGAERIVFVRDGFSFWAFLWAPLWMLWHRMWLVLAGYVVVVAALETPLLAGGRSPAAASVVGLLISLLIGLEASTLRRFTLRRRGWRSVGIVSGDDVEDAERRFFDAWLRQTSTQYTANATAPPPLPIAAAATLRAPHTPDVIGLFPQPGVRQ
jgi:hypothetical protein